MSASRCMVGVLGCFFLVFHFAVEYVLRSGDVDFLVSSSWSWSCVVCGVGDSLVLRLKGWRFVEWGVSPPLFLLKERISRLAFYFSWGSHQATVFVSMADSVSRGTSILDSILLPSIDQTGMWRIFVFCFS